MRKGWTKYKLGDISEMCLGKMLDQEKNKGEFQPYLANINVRWGGFDFTNISQMRFEKSEELRYGLKYGDLVICEGGEPGRCALWKDVIPGMKIQKALHRLRVNDGFSNEFVYYRMLLAGKNGELKKHFIGSTIRHLTGIGLKEVAFEFPPLMTQKRIASVLSTLDAKIELNNRINAELEAMAKALYDYWFVQFDFPNAQGKPYKSSGGKMVWNEELKREIPEGWGNATIESVIAKQPNSDKLQTQDYSEQGLIPIIDQSKEFICGYTDLQSALIKPDQAHIVFGDHTRVVKLINFAYARGADGTQILVPSSPNMPPYLLYQVVASIDLSNYGYARHFKFLKEAKIILPSKSIAHLYNERVESVYRQCSENICQNRELISLRDWLLPMLMNGQVTVA